MPPRLVSEAQLRQRLVALFRQTGFAGVSLGAIAAATGLQKSSLYHRFPGGKEQMAAEVAATVAAHFGAEILAPLTESGPPQTRVREVGDRLRAFYADGRLPCLLDTLSVGDPGDGAIGGLRTAAEGWIQAFAAFAQESGLAADLALARAQDAVAGIEGALVLARVSGDTAAFTRAVERLPDLLLA